MRYNKKNVPLLLVPLLIIIFFSGNASADTYSFSVGSTFGDRDIFNFRVNSVGTINGEATWTGSAADLALILNGPGQEGYYARVDGLSPLSLSYTVTTADLNKGTDWRLSIVNFGSGDATGTVTILYPTELLLARTHPEMVSIVEPRTDVIFERSGEEVAPEQKESALIILAFIYIDIDSSPQGAQIWIDGEYCGDTGDTPFRKYFENSGDHTFKLSLNGYKPYQESFFISESMTLDVVLEPLPEVIPTPVVFPTPPEELSHPSPTPPGFLALSLLIAIFFVYFFTFKNKR